MQGTHDFDPHAKTVIDLEAMVAADHLLRKVDRLVELTFTRTLTASCYVAHLGRPSIDPEVFFRMQLVAYLYGIPSDRRLCEEVRYNLAYRWFCRLALEDPVPDHSSLSRIRDRYGEELFARAFARIVRLCQQRGLVHQECRVMSDGTLMAANAALKSLAPRTAEPSVSSSGRVTNQTHQSQTDPDATLAHKNGTARQLKYKVHQSIDADSRVILDTEVTTGAQRENQGYLAQLARLQTRYGLTITEAIADRGYGSAAILRDLHAQEIPTYIPLWNGRVGTSKYFTAGMTYDKEHDRVQCPQGKYLLPNPAPQANYTRYVSTSADCQACPQTATCPAPLRETSEHQRFVLRSLDQDLFEEVSTRMQTPRFRAKLTERMWRMEGMFAEAKSYHGLARARYRGRTKVQIQAYLSAMAQNLKRLAAVIWWKWIAALSSLSLHTRSDTCPCLAG